MKEAFHKLFNIYANERRTALLFACLGFMWALAVTSGLKFADALFLLHVGASALPIVYILTACAMMVIAAFLLQAFNHFSPNKIFIAVLMTGAAFYVFAYACLVANIGTESKWLWFALRIFGSLLFAFAVTSFWTFLDQYYHLQDAKRLYSLFSAAIFLGIATTGVIMRSGLFDFQHVILFIIALLIATCVLIVRITLSTQPIYDENAVEGAGDYSDNSIRFLIKSIMSSRFTLLLMTSNFLIYLFMITTEYNYMTAFDNYFDPTHKIANGQEETAQLTIFLGKCIAGVSVVNLIFGLFLYSRLVRRFGVNNLLLYTPTFLCLTYLGWLSSDTLLFPIMGFFVVEGMIYTIDDNNFTLLLNAVPHKVKYKIRLMIESFFEPIGMLVSSLLITFAPVDSKVLGLILSGLALIVALIIRKNYLKAIFKSLQENAMHLQRSARDWFLRMTRNEQSASERRLLAMLYLGQSQDQLFALEGLLGWDDEKLLAPLLQRATTFSPDVKVFLLTLLAQSRFAQEPQVLAWINEQERSANSSSVHAALHFYLARLGLLPLDKVARDLDSVNLTLKGAAILSLQKAWDHLPPDNVALNRTVADQYLQQLIDSNKEDEVCMGMTIYGLVGEPADVDILLPFLKSPSIRIARQAATAVHQLIDPHSGMKYVPVLIDIVTNYTDSDLRQECLRALGKIKEDFLVKEIIGSSIHFRPNERRLAQTLITKMGIEIVPIVLAITKDSSMHDRCRVLAGRVLGSLALPKLRENLYDIINIEIERAYFYFYHQHTIQEQYPDLDLSLLQDALLSSFHSVQDFIIQLLAVAGESEDSELLSFSLRSPSAKVRSHVVETLEKTCEPAIFRALYPLIADVPTSEKMQAYLKGGRLPLNLNELLEKLSQSAVRSDQIIAAALKYRLNLPGWRESLKQKLDSNEDIFHHFAHELLET